MPIAAGAYPSTSIPPRAAGCSITPLGDDHAYQIPYRCLIPTALDNALVAGRGISATHRALAAIRVMTISMAVGQAAGTAAALVAAGGAAVGGAAARDLTAEPLRAALLRDGACLG